MHALPSYLILHKNQLTNWGTILCIPEIKIPTKTWGEKSLFLGGVNNGFQYFNRQDMHAYLASITI